MITRAELSLPHCYLVFEIHNVRDVCGNVLNMVPRTVCLTYILMKSSGLIFQLLEHQIYLNNSRAYCELCTEMNVEL